jgi:8-oxo-dGTP pyrophosphatase MutT (NUDIX family)
MEIVYEAGAVVYRIIDNKIEFLIQHSKKDSSKWIFPKGHIEFGEAAQQAATRELEEEAGVIGKNIDFIDNVESVNKDRIYKIQYFLHEFVSVAGAGEPGRDPTWVKPDVAISRLSYNELKILITKSSEIIKKNTEKTSNSFFSIR